MRHGSRLHSHDPDDLERAVEFYEQVTGVGAVRYTPVFAEVGRQPWCRGTETLTRDNWTTVLLGVASRGVV